MTTLTPTPIGQTTSDPAQMAANRAATVAGAGGALKEVGGQVVSSSAPQVQQTTTANRIQTNTNVADFNNNVLPKVTATNSSPAATSSSVVINKGDTLSALAVKYGTTVQELVAANKNNTAALPDANNPNMIIAGANLTLPQSIGGKTDAGTGQNGAGAAGGGAGGGTSGAGAGGAAGANNGTNTGTTTTYDDGSDVITGNQSIDKQINQIKSDTEAQISQITSTMDKMISSADASTQALIQSLKSNYDSLKVSMDDKLQSLKGGLDQSNIRSGRARYAPILAQGIISNAELQESMKLSDAFNKMMLSVSKAQQAQDNNDSKSFNDEYNMIKSAKSEMSSSIQKLYTFSVNSVNAATRQATEIRNQQKQDFQQNLDTSKRSAPGLAKSIASFKNPDDQVAFLQKYSDTTGIPMDILWGDVSTEMQKDAKAAKDIQNIDSTIANREKDKNDPKQDLAGLNDMVSKFLSGNAVNGEISQANYDKAKEAWLGAEIQGADNISFDKQFKKQYTIK